MAWLLVAGLVLQTQTSGLEPITVPATPAYGLEPAITIEGIEVRARRGAAKVPPVVEMDGAQIDAMGAWSIGEVLQELDELYGGSGEALVLINGQRVPLASVFNGFPPDAAVRVEVLPPEASGLYGGRTGQAVYNVVLQSRYASIDLNGAVTAPTQGGSYGLKVQAQRSAIRGMNTHQLRMGMRYDEALLAKDREVLDGAGQALAPDVTLRPGSRGLDASAMMTRTLKGWGTVLGVNAQANETQSVAQYGLDVVKSQREDIGASLSLGASGQIKAWTLNANSSLTVSEGREAGFSPSQSQTQSVSMGLTAQRPWFELPAGTVTSNLNLRSNQNWSEFERSGVFTDTHSQGRDVNLALNLPLLKKGEGAWGRLGSLQADVAQGWRNGGGSEGEETSLGLAWQPLPKLRLNGTWNQSLVGMAAGLQTQPVYYGAPMTVYDFRRGEAVEVLPLLGGSPDLTDPLIKAMSLTFSAGPFTSWQISATLSYNRMESQDGIGTLPDLSEAVEAALPQRFVRDAIGRLIEVDYRPLNLSDSLTETLNLNLNLSLPLARLLPRYEGVGVVQLRAGYNRQLTSQTQLLEGLPVWDRLNGDGGGASQQGLRGSMDVRLGALGVSLNSRWQEGYRSRRNAGVDGADDLVRSDLIVSDLKLTWQIKMPDQQTTRVQGDVLPRRRAKGLELGLDVTNLFEARQEAKLGDGRPAPGYGGDRQDPMGRTLMLSLRRRF